MGIFKVQVAVLYSKYSMYTPLAFVVDGQTVYIY